MRTLHNTTPDCVLGSAYCGATAQSIWWHKETGFGGNRLCRINPFLVITQG